MVAARGSTGGPGTGQADLVSVRDLDTGRIDALLDEAQRQAKRGTGERADEADGRVLATLFYEPSTRTRLSFESAMQRLGGSTISVADDTTSSVAKGESLADTVRVVSGYADAIVLRHPREGAARLAARFSDVPIINAGDGAGEHPTQTLTDLFTIREAAGGLQDVHVALAGDLRYGRTVHSLVLALALYGAELTLVPAGDLRLPERLVDEAKARGATVDLSDSLESVIPEVDIVYQTRVQHERIDEAPAQRQEPITLDLLREAKPSLRVLHPLPRVDGIDAAVDDTEHAAYFQQARNGLPVRMAVLREVLGVGN